MKYMNKYIMQKKKLYLYTSSWVIEILKNLLSVYKVSIKSHKLVIIYGSYNVKKVEVK